MDEGEAFGALAVAGDHEAGDLDDLAVPAGGDLGVALCGGEVALGFGRVTGGVCHDREEGVCDRVHARTMHRRAYSSLTGRLRRRVPS